jgi:hypothetical protein
VALLAWRRYCDVGAAGVCERPLARAAHGACYEPGGFWFRNNYAVCDACFRAGLAEGGNACHHQAATGGGGDCGGGGGGADAPDADDESSWLLSEFHRFLGFVGKQHRREAAVREKVREADELAAPRHEHREHGAELRRAAEAQRASARAEERDVLRARAASASEVAGERERRFRSAEAIEGQRLEHAALSAAEVRRWEGEVAA